MPRKKQDSSGTVTKPIKERLSDREKLYCRYYIHNFSQTRSYMEAFGVSREAAYRVAHQTHTKKAVQAEINRLLDLKLKEIDLRPGSIIQKHLEIAFADINDYVERDDEGGLRLKDLAQADGTAVAEIQYSPQSGAFRIKLNDRQKSLDWLMANLIRPETEDEGTGVVVLADVEE